MSPPVADQGRSLAFSVRMLLLLSAFINVAIVYVIFSSPSSNPDFKAFYTAASVVTQYGWSHLYDLPLQLEQLRKLGGNRTLTFYHAPFEVLLWLPLARFSFNEALLWWRLTLCGLLIAPVLLLARATHLLLIDVLLLTLGLFPVALAIAQGQDSAVLLLVLAGTWLLCSRNSHFVAGFLLAFGLFKPNITGPVAVVLMPALPRQFLFGFLAGAFAIALLSAALIGPAGFQSWLQMTPTTNSHQVGVDAPSMANLRGLLALAHLPDTVVRVLSFVLGSALILAVAAGRRFYSQAKAVFATAILVALLCSFHLNPHDLLLVIIPLLSSIASGPAAIRKVAYWSTVPLYAGVIILLLVKSSLLALLSVPLVIWLVLLLRPASASVQAL